MAPKTRNPQHADADNTQTSNPAQYRRCEVCCEPDADIVTLMVIGDGGDASMYPHRNCTATAAAGVVSE
ncbi:hypothetical protein [Streptomyces melanogenes]|uniref:hypothetical protein n=1 Tax=Streptomyces melanogenes TaxID=67326 RepID=UPI00167E32D8|nr:hypothetical protein [Streptomyces melanogenes]GGP59385.1 hypothetical protein GCM10010278_40640 [Streptomyces melanogenes]